MKRKYHVILIILILVGCESDPIAPPKAAFKAGRLKAEMNEYIHFYNRSRRAETYLWDFGDGLVSNVQSPIHYYSDSGKYTVRLTVTNSLGSDDTARYIIISRPEILWPAPGYYSGHTLEGGHIAFTVSDKTINEFDASFFASIAGTIYELNTSFAFGAIRKTDSGFTASYQSNRLTGFYLSDSVKGKWTHDYGTVDYYAIKDPE